jgi:hypothetical protein
VDYGHDSATALRLSSALAAGDNSRVSAVVNEVAASERGALVLLALTGQALRLLALLDGAGVLKGGLQAWLDDAAMVQLDMAADGQRWLGEDGENPTP